MATTTLRSGASVITHNVTSTYTDVITSISGAANVAGMLRNLTNNYLTVVKGGTTAPDSGSSGEVLMPYDAVFCETDHIWVRFQNGGTATVCFETI